MPKAEYDKSPRTKKLLANAIMELAETMPVSKIKITDICAKAELNRLSFYYHFSDKYDLIAWIFTREFNIQAEKSTTINSEEMICRMLRKIEENKKFFKNVYDDNNQNNLADYEVKMYLEMEEKILKKYLGKEELDEELLYDLRSYSYSCIMHTKEWITDREKMSAETFARRMYNDMPDILKEAYSNIK
ncbi:MAG: TetR/AcrR family transcriptional regulator C-terminal domain-containing protein [Oscillospiraceae bacterium]|nr:TetR/AcrR family transcriptional regulator C-terminal domain-containing protein [Oscillospiraceae bacterium]